MNKRLLIWPVVLPSIAAAGWVLTQMSWHPEPVVPKTVSLLELAPPPVFDGLAMLPAERPSAVEGEKQSKASLLDQFNQVLSQEYRASPKSNQEGSAPDPLDLASLDLSELSPELATRVENALVLPDDYAKSKSNENRSVVELERQAIIWKGRLPKLDLQTHIYASDPKRRWVKVNGREYRQDQWIGDRVKLVEIQPQRVVVEFEGTAISMPALYGWQG